jgi:glycosyltransferase involved in cell wall biosynthesis
MPNGHPVAEPIRLMKFLSVLAIGGSERQAILLGRELDRDRFEVHLGCCVRTDDNIEASLAARGVPVTQYKVSNLYGVSAFRQRINLARYLRANCIDIVHAYNFYSNVFAIPAARLARIPAIASIRDNGECWTPWQRRVERLVCKMADQVVVNADIIKHRLVTEGFDERRITVIHNGTLDIPVGSPQRSMALRAEFDLPPQAPIVGLVARLDPIKGIEYFLEAAALIAAFRPDVRFLIVGGNRIDSVYADGLKKRAASLGIQDIVRFTGFRKDAADLYRLLSVSVLSSLSEGLSNTLLESMAAGLPVVATAVGGNPEAVEDGITGILVPPRDSAALARAICRILDDKELAAAMGRAGRWRVSKHFSTGAMVAATERLYLHMLCRGGGGRVQSTEIITSAEDPTGVTADKERI